MLANREWLGFSLSSLGERQKLSELPFPGVFRTGRGWFGTARGWIGPGRTRKRTAILDALAYAWDVEREVADDWYRLGKPIEIRYVVIRCPDKTCPVCRFRTLRRKLSGKRASFPSRGRPALYLAWRRS